MNVKFQKSSKKYEKDTDMLMSLVSTGEETEVFSREKGTLLYALEAEEIDLKNLEANA
jgi:hypothetical protein